jgi:hypothetical protein
VLACSGQNSCLNASCSGAVCSVECNEAIGACPNDVCCEAGLCQPFQGASDSCP